MNSVDPQTPSISQSASRKRLFTAIAVMIPIVLVLMVEGVVRLLVATPLVEDPFLNIGSVPSFFKTRTINCGARPVVPGSVKLPLLPDNTVTRTIHR